MGCHKLPYAKTDTDNFMWVYSRKRGMRKIGIDYYPFGLSMASSYQRVDAKENRFKYNGKELQSDLDLNWYDYGARMYDAALGRFHSIDPLAEALQEDFSPYSYVKDNPITLIDPTGMIWEDQNQADRLKEDLSNKKGALANKKSKLEAKKAKKEGKGKSTKNIDKRISAINDRTEQLDKSIGDINSLGNDQENVYRLASGDNQGAGKHGVSKGSDGVINIFGSDNGLYVHEIRHVALSLASGGLDFSSSNLLRPTTPSGRIDEIEGYKAQYGYTGGGPGAGSNDQIVRNIANLKDEEGKYVYPAIRQYYLSIQNGLRRSKKFYKKINDGKQ